MGKATILVVEDERVVARDLQRSLEDLGYDVPATAATGEQAIELATRRCPDLVLMDIRIKGVRDGIETAEILRQHFDVPIIYLTAYADGPTVERAKRTAPYGYLLKPVKPNELHSAVEIALHKHTADRLVRDRERWLDTVLRSIGDAVISTDDAGRIAYMNPTAERISGWTAADARGRRSEDVLRLSDDEGAPIASPFARATHEARDLRVSGTLTRPDGRGVRVSDTTSPLLDEGGRALGAVMVFHDVTLEHQLRRQLEAVDRIAMLGTLAGGVAHEVNNPLAYVLTNLSFAVGQVRRLMAGAGVSLTELEAALQDATQGAERVRQLVSELRGFEAMGAAPRSSCDVRDAIDAAVDSLPLDLRGRARIVRHYQDVPAVAGDVVGLLRAFLPLLRNAAQAFSGGGPETNEIRVLARADGGGQVVVEVRDNGGGMTPEVLEKAFAPFFTTRPAGEGRGLGLAVCQGIVHALGGTVKLESATGRGTLATVCLPAGGRDGDERKN